MKYNKTISNSYIMLLFICFNIALSVFFTLVVVILDKYDKVEEKKNSSGRGFDIGEFSNRQRKDLEKAGRV